MVLFSFTLLLFGLWWSFCLFVCLFCDVGLVVGVFFCLFVCLFGVSVCLFILCVGVFVCLLGCVCLLVG